MLPKAPISDDVTDRHRFYGGIDTALETVNEKICYLRDAISHNRATDKDHFDELRAAVEELHIRINKKTYKEDTKELAVRIEAVEAEQKSSQTAWLTGKTFVIGAWVVFSIMFGSMLALLINDFNSYIKIVNANEKIILTQGHKIDKMSDTIFIAKTLNENHAIQITDVLKKLDDIGDNVQSQYDRINRVQGELSKIRNTVVDYHDKKESP